MLSRLFHLRPISAVAIALIFVTCYTPIALASTSPSITTSSLPSGEVSVAYSVRFTATGGTAPYQWTTTSALPTGLKLATNGLLSGTPSIAFDEPVTITVTDSNQLPESAQFVLDIIPGPSIVTTTIPDPVNGTPYSTQLSVAGGVAPYNWSVTSGPLPLGLVLNSTGLLSGLPTASGTTTTTVALVDGAGIRTTASISATVILPTTPPEAYLMTSGSGTVSTYASPGVDVPQTAGNGTGNAVGIATDAQGNRYWLTSSTGQVTSSHGARSFGSVTKRELSGHIVGIAAKSNGSGYWLVSSTGHVYGFGSARSFGSVTKRELSGHIVGIAAKSNGSGYWLVSSTGHVYGFGSAHTMRMRGRTRLSGQFVGIAANANGNGYWLVTRNGRAYAFGGAAITGSIPGNKHVRTVIGIAASPIGNGYWIATRSGTVYPFGTALVLRAIEVAPGTGVTAITGAS